MSFKRILLDLSRCFLWGLLVYPISCLWDVVRNAVEGGVCNFVNVVLFKKVAVPLLILEKQNRTKHEY